MEKKYLKYSAAGIIILLVLAGGFYWRTIFSQWLNYAPPANISPAATPTPDAAILGWLTYKDAAVGLEFKYPADFGANVWHPQFWPPKASVWPVSQDPKNGCPDELSAENHTETNISIGGKNYTLIKGEGIGAGSLYDVYCYITRSGEKNFVLYFSVWSHSGCGMGNCGAYCGTQFETECRNLDRAEQIEKPIAKIVSTFKFY